VTPPQAAPKPAPKFEEVAPARPAAPKPPAAQPAQAPQAPRPPAPQAQGRAIQVDKIDDLLWDLELSLLESDVALPVVEQIKEALKAKLPAIRVAGPDEVPAAVEGALREALLETLSVKPIDFDSWVLEKTLAKKPVVVMFVGVNGTGKTTSIGRVAFRLKENGYTCVMAAGDTFRAGAIQQLERHAEKVGVSFIKTTAGGDPAAVAFDAVEHAKSRMKDVVLLDTAGRMQTNTNLMDEMKKIKRVAKPDLIVFVGDSLAGNDAVEQAVHFDKAVGIDAVILTKVDTDAKGGAALSIAKAVGKPILFLGVGQEYADLIPYDPQWMVDRIFEAA
jgi:fused signal recognition particle receptor